MNELDLWLDQYDDIYSDFDSRYYGKRRISEDFLHEIKTSVEHKKEPVDTLLLILPADKRQESNEKIIAVSLTNYFASEFQWWDGQLAKKKTRGILFLIAGILLMLGNTFITYKTSPSFFLLAMRVLLEPAAWFFLWAAMDFLFYDLKGIKKDRRLFKILAGVKIHFRSE